MATSSPARPLPSHPSHLLLSPSSYSGDPEGLNPSSPSIPSHSSGGKQTYQDAFTQRQRKNDFYSIAKLKLTAKNLAQKSRENLSTNPDLPLSPQLSTTQSPQAQPKQPPQQRSGIISELPKRSAAVVNLSEGSQYLTPIQTSQNGYARGGGQGNHVPDDDDDDAADTDSNHSLPIDLNEDPPILPIHRIPAEKKSPLMVKKDFVPFAPKTAAVVVKEIKTKENDFEDEVESNFAPPPVPLLEEKRPMLHDELIREIRNGRDTPGEALSLLTSPSLSYNQFYLRGEQSACSIDLLSERTQDRQLG
jgi:hypothetical protein